MSTAPSPDPMVSFGVGSFFISPDGPFPYQFSGREHMDLIRHTLEHLPNLNDVSLNYARDFDSQDFELTEPLSEISEEVGFYPHTPHLRLEFRLDLPMRIQQELAGGWLYDGQSLRTNAESFHLSMRQMYHSAIVFVRSIDPTPRNAPSDAVAVVREFLAGAFEGIDHLRFQCLGPSPFHADFFVRPHEESKDGKRFVPVRSAGLGYNRIEYLYDPSVFDTPEEACDAIYDIVQYSFDFYYHLEQVEQSELLRFANLSETVSKLIAMEEKRGLTGYWSRFRSGGLRSRALMKLAELEADRTYRAVPTLRTFRRLASEEDGSGILSDIEDLVQRPVGLPITETDRLLRLFESRRSTALQSLVAAVSGVVGVGIGALLSALFS